MSLTINIEINHQIFKNILNVLKNNNIILKNKTALWLYLFLFFHLNFHRIVYKFSSRGALCSEYFLAFISYENKGIKLTE